VAQLPAGVGFVAGARRTDAALRECRPDQRIDAVADWLARPAIDGVAGVAWPIVDGVARSPVELAAHLERAGVVAAIAAHGPVVGAVIAVPLDLGALERRVVRDAVLAAGVPMVRLVASASAAAVVVADQRPARLLIIDRSARATRATVVESIDGMIDIVGHAAAPNAAVDDDPAARALAAAAIDPAGLSDVVVIGGGAADRALTARLLAPYRHATHPVDDPATVAVRGAARLARMFVDEPAAVTVDVIAPGFSLGAGSALTPMIPAGAIAPTREVRLIARDRADRVTIDLELWEDSAPPRPYGRYRIAGLPPGSGAIAACEVTIDVDRIPRIDASDLVNGGALAVEPVVEVGLGPDALAELRAVVCEDR
jgi:molecular chaperone DnaK (HSP70)